LLFLFATQAVRSTSTPPSSFCPGLAVTNILVDHGNQVSGRLARLLRGLHTTDQHGYPPSGQRLFQ
jgi:hypothetical protein